MTTSPPYAHSVPGYIHVINVVFVAIFVQFPFLTTFCCIHHFVFGLNICEEASLKIRRPQLTVSESLVWVLPIIPKLSSSTLAAHLISYLAQHLPSSSTLSSTFDLGLD
jgi:hypothetical protein